MYNSGDAPNEIQVILTGKYISSESSAMSAGCILSKKEDGSYYNGNEDVSDFLYSLNNTFNINPSNICFDGYSRGGLPALRLCETYQSKYNVSNAYVNLIDPISGSFSNCIQNSNDSGYDYNVTTNDLNILNTYQTNVNYYCGRNNGNGSFTSYFNDNEIAFNLDTTFNQVVHENIVSELFNSNKFEHDVDSASI